MEKLSKEVSSLDNERFIKQLIFKKASSNDESIIFEAPNKLLANFIKSKFKILIQDIIYNELHIKPNIEILVTGEKKLSKKELAKNNDISFTNNSSLNQSYTFDSFVVGSSNQMAYNAAISIADKLGTQYNPLFIYGNTGLGKTHLLQAIGNHVIEQNKSVIYLSFEQFMNDFTFSLKNKNMSTFKNRYRNCDLLLIDDIQFASGKEKSQEEFFHTFNELHSANKQIVLTSDKLPSQIAGLEERLKSRFEWGLTADIQIPELETKIAIIEKKSELNGIELPKDIINFIATSLDSSVREIEGLLIKINASADLLGQDINLDLVKNLLKDIIKDKKDNITLVDIINIVSSELNIKPSDLKSSKRGATIVNARRIVIYLAKELTHNSMPNIAKFLSLKDHSSVSKNITKTNELIKKDANFKLNLENIKNKILTK